MSLTAERVRAVLNYEPSTGVLSWRRNTGRALAGAEAGTVSHGYRAVQLDGRIYRGHRLAWMIVHGAWPAHLIDHINGDKLDNRLENLREADDAVNAQNLRAAQRNNKSSGLLGVYRLPGEGRWMAQITAGRKMKYLGVHPTPEAAHQAYITAKRALHAGCTI